MKKTKVKKYAGTPFSIECEAIANAPGTWDSTKVSIFRNDLLIGEYIRNYPNFGTETFYPFMVDSQWYSMYSPHYTATRVLKLNDGSIEDWCGEAPSSAGFCPMEIYIPKYNHNQYKYDDELVDTYTVDCDISDSEFATSQNVADFLSTKYCNFGFIAGCNWGDDTSCKLKYIDLENIDKKEIKIFDKFGYWELPDRPLKECVSMDNWEPTHQWCSIDRAEHFNLAK